MLKNSFKQLLKFALVMFFGFAFNTNAFAGFIENNDEFSSAHSIGYWEYHSSLIAVLKPNQDKAYFKFMANKGDRVYIKSWNGLSIKIYNNYQQSTNLAVNSDQVTNPTTFPYATVDSDSNFQTFYIEISRTNTSGTTYYSLNINNRISSAIKPFDFTGTASNPGNPNYLANPDGVDSSVISMDLTNNSTIPNGAIVKRITTSGHLNKSLGGIVHKLSPTSTNIWYDSAAPSASNGYFDIGTNSNVNVAQVWNFKYNFKGTSSSNMSNVEASIEYEYDLTQQF